MKTDPNWLTEYGDPNSGIYGERGIIFKILDVIGERSGWCVEFGAGDGKSASNSRSLITDRGYSAVLIEPHDKRYSALEQLYQGDNTIYTMKEFVTFKGPNNLDNLLSNTPVPPDFDLLSVDIDGNDFHIWKSIEKYVPKIVCIEFNNTVPPSVDFIQPADMEVHQGSGLLSFYKLGKEKGYELVCVHNVNAFFVRREYFTKFGIESNSPKSMLPPENLTHIFVGYDGCIFITGRCSLPWHFMEMKSRRFQHLPSFLQKFPPYYSDLERFLFRLWRFKEDPKGFISDVIKRIRRRENDLRNP